jgi:hypothetical protein
MKKIILSLAAALLLPAVLTAGEITGGSVPGSLNYQGRLERDNAPVTGPIHLYFRIFNSVSANNSGGAACGVAFQPCLWQSPEVTVQATQGIFSADITPPVPVLAGGQTLYLEVQVESDTLSPREQLNSVAYALIAKKLEDGADVSVATITAAYNVKLATAAGAVMTVGTDTPAAGAVLTVNGWLDMPSGGIVFPDNTFMTSYALGSASGISTPGDVDVIADNDSNLVGDVMIRTPYRQHVRISTSGNVGIGNNFTADGGAAPPKGRLDVDGSFYVGDEGIYDRDDSTVNVRGNIAVDTGIFIGKNDEQIRVGVANDIIAFAAGGLERARIHSDGYFGVGRTPLLMIHSAEDIAGDTGARGGRVSLGDFSTWGAELNEVRAQNGYHLLLQQTNSYNVGIGTDTPRQKLHVRGSVMADYGVIAATAAFSGNVSVNGTFSADSKQGNTVELSSTTINGWLIVSGGIGSQAGLPAYINSTQTFTGQNIFNNQVKVSSDIFTINRIGAGVVDFDFPGTKYLQVGDDQGGTFPNDNGLIYLVGGANANAKLNFYRGTTLGATLGTQNGSNLGLVVGGSTKTLTDATYHRIQNSVLWVSTGYNTTPAIFVSSTLGSVGIGTSIPDPNWRMTVAGSIRLSGTGSSIIFDDGSSMATSSATSATFLSNNGNAIVQSNADLSGGGDVILRAGSLDGLVLNTGGQVGIGTLSPLGKLNLRGGDLVLGNPYNPYGSDAVEDLVVAGNIAFDGELIQRSALAVQFSKLIVAHDVYLSTNTSYKTGIGTLAPSTSLDVNGNAQFGSGITKSTFTAAGVLQLAQPLGVAYGGAGASLSGVATGGILYKSAAATVGGSAALTGVLKGNNTGAPTAMTSTLGYNAYWSAADTLSGEQYTNVTRGGTGVGALTGIVKGNNTSDMTALTGVANAITYWSDVNTIAASTILSHNGTRLAVTGASDFSGSVTTASSGTFKLVGGTLYSVVTSSGIKVSAGSVDVTGYVNVTGRVATAALRMPTGASNNYVMTTDANGNASWENPALGAGDGWVGNEVTDAADATLTLSGNGLYLGTPRKLAINLANSNDWSVSQTFSGGLTCTNCITLSAAGSEVTGTLPLANGGTGGTTAALARASLVVPTRTGGDASGTWGIDITGNAATVTNGLITTTNFGGDVSGAYNAIVVANDSHTHSSLSATLGLAGGGTGGTTAALARANLVVPTRTGGDASGTWGIDITGNAATVTNGLITTTNFAGDVSGAYNATVVANDSHTHGNGSITGGASGTFDVAISTTTPAQCKSLTVTNGIITTIGANHNCD